MAISMLRSRASKPGLRSRTLRTRSAALALETIRTRTPSAMKMSPSGIGMMKTGGLLGLMNLLYFASSLLRKESRKSRGARGGA